MIHLRYSRYVPETSICRIGEFAVFKEVEINGSDEEKLHIKEEVRRTKDYTTKNNIVKSCVDAFLLFKILENDR